MVTGHTPRHTRVLRAVGCAGFVGGLLATLVALCLGALTAAGWLFLSALIVFLGTALVDVVIDAVERW